MTLPSFTSLKQTQTSHLDSKWQYIWWSHQDVKNTLGGLALLSRVLCLRLLDVSILVLIILLTCKKLLKAKINWGNGLVRATIYYQRWVSVKLEMKVPGVSSNSLWQAHNRAPLSVIALKHTQLVSSIVRFLLCSASLRRAEFSARDTGISE